MSRLFTALIVFNMALLGSALVVGYLVGPLGLLGLHVALGVGSALASALVQCVCFTYFLGTGRWVAEATQAHKLDLGYYRRSRVLKRNATFLVLGGLAAVFLAAWLGGALAASMSAVSVWMHEVAAVGGMAAYGIVCVREGRLIRLNLDMLDKLVAAVNRASGGESA
ncbi:MAG: hypothetical protein BIFFINMI_04312 [Phycisphaerae bacterium]|nr:hypothetical protein [Phycisphaerae bacterium]